MECLNAVRVSRLGRLSLVRLRRPFPMVGHIAFGIIDRGTNVIQVRPSTLCFHDCIFCSVDAGPSSTRRASEYIVEDVEYLAEWTGEVARLKGGAEVLIDGVGEPLTNPRLPDLIRLLRDQEGVTTIAIETHGGSLSLPLLRRLAEAGLNRVNLSIDTLDPAKARVLTNSAWYDIARIKHVVEEAFKQTSLDFVLTPVVVPGYNEDDMVQLIEWARSLGLGSKIGWPSAVLIQKYEVHKHGRKVKGVRPWSWGKFYEYLRSLERRTGYRLVLRPDEIGIRRTPRLPRPYRRGSDVRLTTVGPGWLRGESLAVDQQCLRSFTLIASEVRPGTTVVAKVIEDDNNIYVAKLR